jgi:hypothetical protein
MPLIALLILALLSVTPAAVSAQITVDTSKPLHEFSAGTAFGATVDAHPRGETREAFTSENVDAMLTIGFQPLSYRLATELAVEAWHWNPLGQWSDAQHEQGYWTSSPEPGARIELCYGYRLPRRGNTIDQAENDGYSRIDDGDPSTFWKSNPYVDEHFAGEEHPQWIVADLGSRRNVNAIRIAWGEPHAVAYRVQYWDGSDPMANPVGVDWVDFQGVTFGTTVRADAHRTRWIRILLLGSSYTSERASNDPRDSCGFAVRELSIGTIDRHGNFHDVLRHGRSRTAQSVIWVSSTDPWHRASDIDRDMEHIGIDALFATGLTRGRGLLTPVSLLYGTPENAAAEIEFMRRRGYPISAVEMGEEPDGQNTSPEDYAALYRQFARALHSVDPALRLGGPGFQSTVDFVAFWPDPSGSTAWLTRFISDLRRHGQLADFSFFSFEWYPFDNICESPQLQIERAPALLRKVIDRWRREGLPDDIPWIATEYGYSSYAGQPEVDIYAALFNSEFVAQFLSMGGSAAYFYTYEPDVLIREASCPTWGNLTPFLSDDHHRIRAKLAAYWAARMVTQEWSGQSGEQQVYRVDAHDAHIGAYALRRADGTLSVLLINRSTRSSSVRIDLGSSVRVTQYSPEQYVWKAQGEDGHPVKDLPPVARVVHGDVFTLPPHSITVLCAAKSRIPADSTK